ncbi:MAG TPA: site-2 protease family protein [Opitutaceae bacterium]|nr:site-2 protease family protein [Opitutaceae bacterium]
MLGWSIKLFRIRGIQLAVHFTFVLWLAWWALLGYQDAGLAGAFWSAAELVAFFTCVVLHELGHCFTGMRFGMRVQRILLMPIGGMAQFDAIPRQPRQEILMTLAGPAVNFVIAAVLYIALGAAPDLSDVGSTPIGLVDLLHQLMAWNLIMGCFNMIPAFPMDGGRILRAVLACFVPYLKATRWAATCGKVVCGVLIAASVYFHAYMPAILFAFIFMAGEGEYRMILRQEVAEAHWKEMMSRIYVPPPPNDEPEPPLLHRP